MTAVAKAVCGRLGHKWRYFQDPLERKFTGYLERCARCGEIRQVPQ